MTQQNQKKVGAMRTPHRRDISARQDLLGRELRQLFDGYSQEEMPAELQRLAEQLQGAVGARPPEPAEDEADPEALDAETSQATGAGARKSKLESGPRGGDCPRVVLDKAEER